MKAIFKIAFLTTFENSLKLLYGLLRTKTSCKVIDPLSYAPGNARGKKT